MVTKIRLQRGGRKGYTFYNIVTTDSRAPRDGKFIEKIGTYNPNTNPAAIDLSFDGVLYWLEVGAQPTGTARNILKCEGVYLMERPCGGVKKGAFDEAAMQSRFDAQKQDKDRGLQTRAEIETQTKKDTAAKGLEAEKKINAEMAKRVTEKKAAVQAEEAEAVAEEEAEATAAEAETTTEEAPAAAE